MNDKLTQTIIDLWHISRTALATQSHGTYERMLYIKNELTERYAEVCGELKGKRLWFFIEDTVGNGRY